MTNKEPPAIKAILVFFDIETGCFGSFVGVVLVVF
jgi:hypothetical protein